MENEGVQIQLLGEFSQQAHRLGIIENVLPFSRAISSLTIFSQFGIGAR